MLTFFWRCENSTTLDIDAGDYSAGDETGTGSLNFSTAQAWNGSYSIDHQFNTNTQFDFLNIGDGVEGSIGIAVYPDTLQAGAAFKLYDADNATRRVRLDLAADGDVSVQISSTQGSTDVTTTGTPMSADSWFYVVARWHSGKHEARIEVYDSDMALLETAENLAINSLHFAENDLSGSLDVFVVGDEGGGVSLDGFLDHVMIADRYDEPLQDYALFNRYEDYLRLLPKVKPPFGWSEPPVTINRQHPSAQGLQICIPFFTGSLQNIGASRAYTITPGSGAVWTTGLDGQLAFGATGAVANARIEVSPSPLGTAVKSVMLFGTVHGVADTSSMPYGDRNSGSTNHGHLNWDDFAAGDGDLSYAENLGNCAIRDIVALEQADFPKLMAFASSHPATDVDEGIIGTTIWEEIHIGNEAGTTATPGYTPDSDLWIGEGRSARNVYGAWTLFLFWDRRISESEMYSLLTDPKQIFNESEIFFPEPPKRKLVVM